MKLIALLFNLLAFVSAQRDYYYGKGNFLLCGQCKGGQPCNSNDGSCSQGCEAGWSGRDCQTPLCDDVSCGENAGFCSGPNQCTCAKNYAQNSEDGGCHSMRVAGLKGAACALVVIITSITICGTIQSQREKAGKIQT